MITSAKSQSGNKFTFKKVSMDLDQAIRKHAEWKMKFSLAISKQEAMDVAMISTDNCCELGKWLHGDGIKRYGKLAGFTECVAKHAVFHVEAGKVAETINDKKYVAAEAMLQPGTPYEAASSAVWVAIKRLRSEAGL